MKNKFYFGYHGNKRQELHEIFKYIEKDNYTDFYEIFGGSCQVSMYLFNFLKFKGQIHMYDIDEELVFFCNHFKDYKEQTIEKANEEMNKITNKEQFIKYIKTQQNKDEIINYLAWILLKNSWYKMELGMYHPNKKPKFKKLLDCHEFDNLFENFQYNFKDSIELIEYLSEKNHKTFIYCDPPYQNAKNQFYKHNSINFLRLKELFMSSCHVMLNVSFDEKIDEIFRPISKQIHEYPKKYNLNNINKQRNNGKTSKPIKTHIIYLNFS